MITAALVAQTITLSGDLPDAFDALPECPGGCSVRIEPGSYAIDRPISVCGRVHVEAYGADICSNGVTGVVFRSLQEGCQSARSSWRGGSLRACAGTYVGTSTAAPLPVGVDIRAGLVQVSQVSATGFARGVQAICSDNAARDKALGFEVVNGALCNSVRLAGVEASASWLDGIYFFGRDANAGHVDTAEVSNNCRRAFDIVGRPEHLDSATRGGQCANAHDASFLGNTWTALHSAHALDTVSTSTSARVRYHQILATNGNARTVWTNPYMEDPAGGGQDPWTRGNGGCALEGYGHWMVGGLNSDRCRTLSGATVLTDRGRVNGGMEFWSGTIFADGTRVRSRLVLGSTESKNNPGSAFAYELIFRDGSSRTMRLNPRSNGLAVLEWRRNGQLLTIDSEDGSVRLRVPVEVDP